MDIRYERYRAAVRLITMNDVMVTARRADMRMPNVLVMNFAATIATYDQLTRRIRRSHTIT